MTSDLTRAESAAVTIRGAILAGQHLSGERLVEVKIAQMLDVSQNTIRDALRILEQESWVVKRPRHGVFVRSFSAADAAEVCTLIAVIEAQALAWAMERIDKPTRAELQTLLAAARKFAYVGDLRPSFEQLVRFHERIGTAAGKPLTAHLLETLFNQVRLLEALRQARAPRGARELDAMIDDHETLLRLISLADPQAACAHLRQQIDGYSAETVAALRL